MHVIIGEIMNRCSALPFPGVLDIFHFDFVGGIAVDGSYCFNYYSWMLDILLIG